MHPSTTTRAKSAEEREAAGAALRLLRLFTTLVRPHEAGLSEAFSFKFYQTTRSGRRQHTENNNLESKPDRLKELQIDLSTINSLWTRAQDFWHAVGWAFNCSVNHPARWERWQIWLEFMCDVIEDDWAERVKLFDEQRQQRKQTTHNAEFDTNFQGSSKTSGAKDHGDERILRESLIYQYMTSGPSSGRMRRIARAIFADGSLTSVNEFGKVFNAELKPLEPTEQTESAKKRGREVNIDQEEYGDYLAAEDTDGDTNTDPDCPPSRTISPSSMAATTEHRRPKRTRRGTRSAPDPSGQQPAESASDTRQGTDVFPMDNIPALVLRKRLLQLLCMASSTLPKDLIPTDDLLLLCVEHIRPLPLPVFQAIINPFATPRISDKRQFMLCDFLIGHLQESAAPTADDSDITQAKLERCFLPYAAASTGAADNAKISILLESLIVLLADDGMLVTTPSFKKALENGVKRRNERPNDGNRRAKKNDENEAFERECLKESGIRLVYLMDLLPQDENT